MEEEAQTGRRPGRRPGLQSPTGPWFSLVQLHAVKYYYYFIYYCSSDTEIAPVNTWRLVIPLSLVLSGGDPACQQPIPLIFPSLACRSVTTSTLVPTKVLPLEFVSSSSSTWTCFPKLFYWNLFFKLFNLNCFQKFFHWNLFPQVFLLECAVFTQQNLLETCKESSLTVLCHVLQSDFLHLNLQKLRKECYCTHLYYMMNHALRWTMLSLWMVMLWCNRLPILTLNRWDQEMAGVLCYQKIILATVWLNCGICNRNEDRIKMISVWILFICFVCSGW